MSEKPCLRHAALPPEEGPMDSEMHREIARLQQTDLARLADRELLVSGAVGRRRLVHMRRPTRLDNVVGSFRRLLGAETAGEEVPEAPAEIGPA